MFEKILERVLLSHFGKYLTGFDKNNLKLGVWSGNVVIENVKLKAEIIDSLELPIELKHSTIGRLVMQVPWNKLSSSPVEVLIEDILIVIAPKDPKSWDFSDKRLVQKKFNVLLRYASAQFEKFMTKKKKKNESEDQQGYFDKLTLKVIDNLQLQVKNIHVRWESNNTYAWGLKLDSLDAYTTNYEWLKVFIDRTDEKNRLTPINKLVMLSRLCIYWNAAETVFLQETSVEAISSAAIEEVINITAEFKWSQNIRSQFAQPLFDVFFDLNWIDINLKHSQLQQLIAILESVSLYTKLLWMERKGQSQVKYNSEEFKQTYCQLFAVVQKSESKSMDVLSEKEQEQLNEIVKQVEYDTLFQWTQGAMKSLILESKVQQLQKERTKKGWFGWGASGDTSIQDQEVKDLEMFIETTLSQQTDEFESIAIVRPALSIKYRGIIILKGGSIQVTKRYTAGPLEQEGVKLNCKDVELHVESKQNSDFDSRFTVGTIGVYMHQKPVAMGAQLIPLCFQSETDLAKRHDDHFFKFGLQKCQAANKDLSVKCKVEPITWVYNPTLIGFIREMKDVKKGQLEESLKSATWQRLEKIQDTTQSRVSVLLASALQLDLQFELVSLKVVLPMPGSQREAWTLNIEGIEITSAQNTQADIYEYFDVSIVKSSFIYDPQNIELMRALSLPREGEMATLSVLREYTLKLRLAKLKNSVKDLVQGGGNPLLRVSASLPNMHLTLNEKLYRDLIYIPEAIFPPQTESQRLEQYQAEKMAIWKQATKKGWIKRRGDTIRMWSRSFMVLSGGYLYLYDTETALMHTQTVYIKNAVIKPLAQEEEEYAYTLENRYDGCHLAFESAQAASEWTQELARKIREYATEDEYIKMNALEQEEASKKGVNSLLELQLDAAFTEITIYKGTQMEEALFYVRTEAVEYHYLEQHGMKTSKARMKGFLLRDWQFHFENTAYQDLIKVRSSNSQPSLDVTIVQVKPFHESYAKVDMLVKCAVQEIHINWKPDTFLKLRDFMLVVQERKSRKWYYQSVKDYEVDSLKKGHARLSDDLRIRKLTEAMKDSKSKCDMYSTSTARVKPYTGHLLDYESFMQNYDWIYSELIAPHHQQQVVVNSQPQSYQKPSAVIIQVECQIASARINCFQMQSHACLIKLELQLAGFTFRKMHFTNFLECSLHDISLYDMTNYPFSIDSNKDYEKVVPFKLIGRRPGYDGGLVRFRFSGYEELIFPNADRVNVYLLIEIAPIFAIYQHQPIMRTIDYIIVQIVSLLREPEFLTMNAAVLAQKRQRQSAVKDPLKARRVWGALDEVFKRFICPTFIDCRVVLQRPNLQVKGWQGFDQYFQIDAAEIVVFNGQRIDDSRLLKKGGISLIKSPHSDGRVEHAWCESYFVEAKELVIEYSDKGIVKGMSAKQNFNLSFERLLHQNEVQEVYPEVEYDRHLRIRSAMTPIVLKAYRDEYLQICRMIFHNFQYDDLMDRILIHDFEVVRSFDPAPISFFLDFAELNIFAMSETQPQPLARITMRPLRLKWIREGTTMNIELDLFSEVCTMFHYVECEDGCIEERGFVGDLKRKVRHRLMGKDDGFHLDRTFYQDVQHDLKQEFTMYEFPQFDEKNMQFTLLFKIIRPLSEKNIYIYLRDVKMIVMLSVFANVGLWSLLDQMCWPPQNDFGEMPEIQLFVEIRNASLCLPATNSEQVMATKGEISYVWSRHRMPNHQWMIMQQQEGKLNPRLVAGIGDAFEHKVTLQSLELFKCNFDDFITLNITEVNKRNVVMPFSFFLGIKNELQITSGAEPQIYYLNKYECNMDKTIVKFSYQDLIVLMDIIDFSSRQAKLIRREPGHAPPPPAPPTPFNNVYDAIIHGLQIVIINDAGEAYVPVFDLTLNESQLIFHQTKSKSILSTVISLSSTFFNPLIAVWEPIIERCTFALDMSLNAVSNPKKYIILEMNSPTEALNINISTQMLSVFHKTYLSWAKEMSKKAPEQSRRKRGLQHSSIASQYDLEERKESQIPKAPKLGISKSQFGVIEAIDHVSPYTIRNETGFVIEVEDDQEDSLANKYVIQTGGSANYQIDADVEQVFLKDQSTIKRLIRFQVVHPQHKFTPVTGVDLDSIRTSQVLLKSGLRGFNLFVEVVPKDTRKLLLITSEVMIYNKTDQAVDLKFFECEGDTERNTFLQTVDAFRAISVPFDRTRAFVSFRFAGQHSQYSQMIDLAQIVDLREKTFECRHSDNQFTLMRCTKRGTNQTVLYLEPPYVIKNCLPNEIGYEIFSDEMGANAEHLAIDITSTNYTKHPYHNLKTVVKGQHQPQQEIQVHNVSQYKRLALKVKLPFYQWSDMGLLYNPSGQVVTRPTKKPQPETSPKVDNIIMCDYRGKMGFIEIAASDSKQGTRSFYLYVPAFAVNDTTYQLFLYTNVQRNQRSLQLSAGQMLKQMQIDESSKVILLGNPLYTQISLHDEIQGSILSKDINMNSTGNDSVSLTHPTDLQVYELGINLSLVCVDQSLQLFTKVLTISPRFVIVNFTDLLLRVVQEDSSSDPYEIKSQQRLPFTWSRCDKPKQYRVQLVEFTYQKEVYWGYSQPLDPNQAGFTCFTLRSMRNRSSIKYVSCQMRTTDQIVYLLFQECRIPPRIIKAESEVQKEDSHCEIPYIIVNCLADVTLVCYQSCFAEQSFEDEYQFSEFKTMVPPTSQMPFAWEYPTKQSTIVVEMRFEGQLNQVFRADPILLSLEDMDMEKEFTLRSANNDAEFKFYVMTSWEGQSKRLKIYQEEQIMERMRQEDIIELQLGVSISQIGISVLDQDGPKRVELLFITLKSVEFMLLETTVLRTSQLKIKYINIDNNSSYRTMFPVIMTPTKYKEIFEFDRPQLSLVIAQSTQAKTLTLIKSIRAWLQPTTIRLTSEVLENIYALFKNIQQQLKTNVNEESLNAQHDFEYALEFQLKKKTSIKDKENVIYMSNQVQSKYGQQHHQRNRVDTYDWLVAELPLQAKTTYIDRIEIYPLYFNITFYNSVHTSVQYGTLVRILKTVGIVMGNIDEAPIKLNGIYLENCFDTSAGITQKLATHYKDNLTQQLLKILGSIEIIGNPVGLVKNIGIGVYDLFDKPIEGFIKGPIEGGIGIGKGAGSLVKNVVSGTSNSVGKISGAIASGCSTISMDPQFQRKREKMRMAKPRQIFEGISQGVLLLWQGLQRGVTGVVQLPLEGARQNGLGGALLGTFKGATGFFAKPLAGLFDFGSKTAEGVKATAVYWDDKANERRERDIRVMYAQEQFYKGYNEKDACVMAFLQSNWKGKYGECNLFDAFLLGTHSATKLLVLSLQWVLYIDYQRRRVLWIFDSKVLLSVDMLEHGVMFNLREMPSTLNSKNALVQCPETALRNELYAKAKWLAQSVT